VLFSQLFDRARHELLSTASRAIRLGVDRNHLIGAGEQSLEVFGGKLWGAGEDDAQWLSHGLLDKGNTQTCRSGLAREGRNPVSLMDRVAWFADKSAPTG
jgi:hypothetical protein